MEKERIEMCKYGTVQVGIDNAWNFDALPSIQLI